uniref:Tetratricopeptide repeat protein 38 n=1 Tax=Heterorhabditis bacteriophora TaxID=37862 RepID=A0A1I7XDD6_HETBA
MPRAFRLGLEGMGMSTCARVNPVFTEELQQLNKDAADYGTKREQKHVKAVKQWAEGEMRAAANTWEDILAEFPTDLMACKFAHEAYFFMGDRWNKRDSVKRVIGKYKGTEPCYSYLHGMLAFGLEECGEYRKAEKEAQQALSLNRFDSWATHATAHVMEMEGRQDEGIHFMENTVNDWKPGWMIATHNFWHNALFYIEKAEYEISLSIFDQEISPRLAKSGSMLDMVDAVSLLWRLEMEGVNVGKRWNTLPSMQKHIHDHVIVFNDVHLGPMLLKMEDYDDEIKLHDSLVNFSRCCTGDNARVSRLVGVPLYEGMIHYGRGNFDEAAAKLLPIRDTVYTIGGSNAQEGYSNSYPNTSYKSFQRMINDSYIDRGMKVGKYACSLKVFRQFLATKTARILYILGKTADNEKILDEMLLEVDESSKESIFHSVFTVLKEPHLRTPFFIGCLSLQLIVCIWPIIYLSTDILEENFSEETSQIASLAFIMANFIAGMGGMFIIEKYSL